MNDGCTVAQVVGIAFSAHDHSTYEMIIRDVKSGKEERLNVRYADSFRLGNVYVFREQLGNVYGHEVIAGTEVHIVGEVIRLNERSCTERGGKSID